MIANLDDFKASHMYREGNAPTDYMENLGVDYVEVKWWNFFMPPNSCYSIGFSCFLLGLLLCVLGLFSFFVRIVHFMGGDKDKMEATSFENWKWNTKVWNEISDGGLVPYMERLKGNSLSSTEDFVSGWDC